METAHFTDQHIKARASAADGRLVLGIDPGKAGAIALLRVWHRREQPRLELLGPAADSAMVLLAAHRWPDLTVVERQQASPQMGVVGAFSLGMAVGRLQGLLEGMRVGRVIEVAPSAWRASYGLPGGAAGKVAGLGLAQRLLGPGHKPLARHDEADAILIAWWGWQHRKLAHDAQDGAGCAVLSEG